MSTMLLCVVASLLASASPAQQSFEPKITLVHAGKFLPKSVTDADYRKAIWTIIRDEGGVVLAETEVSRDCGFDAHCLLPLAAPGSTYMFVINGNRVTTESAPEYDVAVALRALPSGRLVDREGEAGCKFCLSQELVQKVAGSLRRIMIDERARVRGAPPAAVAASPAAEPITSTANPEPATTPTNWVGTGFLGTGLAAFGGGIWLLAINNNPVDCEQTKCVNRLNTKGIGLGSLAVGAVLIALGGWNFFSASHAESKTSLLIGPGSLTVMGRF